MPPAENAIALTGVTKTFGSTVAVRDLRGVVRVAGLHDRSADARPPAEFRDTDKMGEE